jgi:hypothetical protein
LRKGAASSREGPIEAVPYVSSERSVGYGRAEIGGRVALKRRQSHGTERETRQFLSAVVIRAVTVLFMLAEQAIRWLWLDV